MTYGPNYPVSDPGTWELIHPHVSGCRCEDITPPDTLIRFENGDHVLCQEYQSGCKGEWTFHVTGVVEK